MASPLVGLIDRTIQLGAREPSVDSRAKVDDLNVEHPEYENRHEAWTDLALMYEGGAMLRGSSERLLKKRPREDEEVYAARRERFTYQNILGTALGWYGAALFETDPEVFFSEGNDKFYSGFLEDCDGIGTSYVDFFKRVFQNLLTFGSAWVLTDTKTVEEGEQPQTLQEEKVRGLLDPHLILYSPLDVINWKTDPRGELQWAVAKTVVEDQEFLGAKMIVYTWYYYDKKEYRVYEDRMTVEEAKTISSGSSGRSAKLIRQGAHSLALENRLPLRKVTLSEGLWLANRAYLLLLDHINQDNTLAWSLFMSNLAIPVIIGDIDTSNMTHSESGYLQFPTGTEYKWTEPEGKSFLHSAKRVEALREECFRSMNLQSQGRSMRATPAMQSGRSKLLEMAPAQQILSGMGDDIRRHMQQVLKDVISARREAVVPDVRGFSFDDDMTTEEVFAVTSLMGLRIPSDTFEKYIYKKVAKSWMTDANRKELETVYKEIEAGPTMDDRLADDFADRVKLAKAGLSATLKGGGSSSMPPGRGGSGPSPRPTAQ